MRDWAELRSEFPHLDRWIYLNACSLGPLPRAGREALERYAAAWDAHGTPAWYSDLDLAPALRHRQAGGERGQGGRDRRRQSGRTRRRAQELGDPRWSPAVAGCRSWTASAMTGYLQDVRAIADAAHANGALGVIDGYQTVGCVPIDVAALDCDAFVTSGTRPYVRPELIPLTRPQGTGWFATKDPFSYHARAAGFRRRRDERRSRPAAEPGTWPVPSHYAALAGLDLILEVGVENIQQRLRELTNAIVDRYNDASVEIFTPREPAALRHRDPGVTAAAAGRGRASRGRRDRRLAARAGAAVAALVRHRGGAPAGNGPRAGAPGLPAVG